MADGKTSRRQFMATTGAATAGLALGATGLNAAMYSRVVGANDKVRVGFIGVGNRGTQLLHHFMNQSDCQVAALCDVYEPFLSRDRSAVHPRYIQELGPFIPRMGEPFGDDVKRYADYRRLLEDESIDAVCIATPDHWHALQTIHAVQAGKDVFVEKPLTMTIREGRAMLEAERNSRQVVAVGLNRRGSAMYQKLAQEIPAGKIGKVTTAHANRISNMYPHGIGKMQPEDPPADLNWDAWIGPRAYRPYQYNIAPYKFRWWSDYSSQMANWGVHFMDAIRWMINEKAPVAISAHGSATAIDDDRDIPDTMHVIFEFASGVMITFNINEAASHSFFPHGDMMLRGSKATLFTSTHGYRLIPTQAGQFQKWDALTEAQEHTADDDSLPPGLTRDDVHNLVRNFLDCVKSRGKPMCTLEDGHLSTNFAHLANIAMATRQRLQWDAVNERFTNSEEANQLLHYEYRHPYAL